MNTKHPTFPIFTSFILRLDHVIAAKYTRSPLLSGPGGRSVRWIVTGQMAYKRS